MCFDGVHPGALPGPFPCPEDELVCSMQKATPLKKLRRWRSKPALIEALGHSMGNVSAAAEALGVSRQWLSKKVNTEPELADAREQGTNRLLDVARNALLERILAGDTAAIIYTLKSQGKHDGWAESPRTIVNQTNSVEAPEDRLARWKSML